MSQSDLRVKLERYHEVKFVGIKGKDVRLENGRLVGQIVLAVHSVLPNRTDDQEFTLEIGDTIFLNCPLTLFYEEGGK